MQLPQYRVASPVRMARCNWPTIIIMVCVWYAFLHGWIGLSIFGLPASWFYMVLQFYDIFYFYIQVTLPSAGDHRRWGRHRKTPCDQQLKKCDLISFQLNSPQFGVCDVLFPIHRSRWFGWFSASKFCKNAGADDVCRRSVGGGNIPESGAALQAPFQSWKTQGNNPRIGNFIHNQNSHVYSFDSDWFWTPAVDLMVLPPVILFWAKPGQTALERLGGGKGCLHQAAMTYRSLQFLYSLLVCWPFPTFSAFLWQAFTMRIGWRGIGGA